DVVVTARWKLPRPSKCCAPSAHCASVMGTPAPPCPAEVFVELQIGTVPSSAMEDDRGGEAAAATIVIEQSTPNAVPPRSPVRFIRCPPLAVDFRATAAL